jgi:RND family efflux transporter MFP subunit
MVSGLLMLISCSPQEENQVVEAKPRSVRVDTIASRDLPIVVNSVGRLNPNREVVLSAQVSGILIRYNADVGSKVAAGATIVRLDDTDYALALNEAEANLLAAQAKLAAVKSTFVRTKRLLPDKVITQERFDQVEAEYKFSIAQVTQLEAMVAMAQRRLDKTTIKTPFGGYVTNRLVEIGQNVAVGEPVMSVADMKTMRVKIYINELEYVHLDKDDLVEVTVEAFSRTPIIGHVDKIGIQADPRTNTFEIEILVDNSDFNLKAGLQNTIIFRENRKEVFVVEAGNLAAAREVKMGRLDGSEVHILEGLMPGDKLVVEGGQYLKPGDKVVVEQ